MSLENSYLRDGPELCLLNNTVIYKRVRGEDTIKEGALNSCQKARETGSCAGVMCTGSSPCLERDVLREEDRNCHSVTQCIRSCL